MERWARISETIAAFAEAMQADLSDGAISLYARSLADIDEDDLYTACVEALKVERRLPTATALRKFVPVREVWPDDVDEARAACIRFVRNMARVIADHMSNELIGEPHTSDEERRRRKAFAQSLLDGDYDDEFERAYAEQLADAADPPADPVVN